jgi:CheY-like chemotaxis protein
MPYKLLLADDSVTIQRVIELTFADEDVQVVAVGDGKKAIASIEADRPDIVLADVGMPERDGYEVAAFVKGNPRLADIPVLLLTGAFEPIEEARARSVGCDGVLVKPFEPQMVINRVKDLLAGRRSAGLWSASPVAQGPTRHPSPDNFNPGSTAPAVPSAAPQASQAGGSLEDYFDRLDAAFANLDGGTETQCLSPAPSFSSETLSADFASEQAQPASSGFSADVLDGWDPDLTGDPKRVVPLNAPPAAYAPPAVSTPPPSYTHVPAAPPAAAAQGPTLEWPPAPSLAYPPTPQSPAPPAYAPAAATPVASAPAVAAPVAVAPVAAAPALPMPSLAEAFATLLSAEQSQSISPSRLGASSVSGDVVDEIVRRVIARLGDQAVRETVIDIAERLVREEIERIKGN